MALSFMHSTHCQSMSRISDSTFCATTSTEMDQLTSDFTHLSITRKFKRASDFDEPPQKRRRLDDTADAITHSSAPQVTDPCIQYSVRSRSGFLMSVSSSATDFEVCVEMPLTVIRRAVRAMANKIVEWQKKIKMIRVQLREAQYRQQKFPTWLLHSRQEIALLERLIKSESNDMKKIRDAANKAFAAKKAAFEECSENTLLRVKF